jgi:hypothetical protein
LTKVKAIEEKAVVTGDAVTGREKRLEGVDIA